MHYRGNLAFFIRIERAGVKMPLREQFVYEDAVFKAAQAARTNI
jgi:hypothetical protein